jgi:hypothetical protein
MNLALNELKIKSKILLKSIKNGVGLPVKMQQHLKMLKLESLQEVKLKHCHFLIAKQYSFDDWQHAQQVLSGNETTNTHINMGAIFHSSGCDALINLWFSSYEEAKSVLALDNKDRWLVPYKQQYIIVNKAYLKLMGIDAGFDQHWNNVNHDLVQGYNCESWDKLALAALKNR